ncbi:16546_t:CDS:2, partial [Funneliformis geosporum]
MDLILKRHVKEINILCRGKTFSLKNLWGPHKFRSLFKLYNLITSPDRSGHPDQENSKYHLFIIIDNDLGEQLLESVEIESDTDDDNNNIQYKTNEIKVEECNSTYNDISQIRLQVLLSGISNDDIQEIWQVSYITLHQDLTLKDATSLCTCDLGLSKSATEAADNETYGIIPYVAPEVLQGQKYTKKSDIYSFGMIMWECMTGRRPFWDCAHDTELILDICDGLRPPIGDIAAPEGYIELMKKCWDPNPNKRLAT